MTLFSFLTLFLDVFGNFEVPFGGWGILFFFFFLLRSKAFEIIYLRAMKISSKWILTSV